MRLARLAPSPAGLALAAAAWLVVALVAIRAPVAVRAPCVFGLVALVPGAALYRRLARTDAFTKVVITIGASLAISAIAAEALALAHLFSGLNAVIALAGTTSFLALGRRRDHDLAREARADAIRVHQGGPT